VGDDNSLSWQERADLVAALDVGTYFVSGHDLYINVGMDTELATTVDLNAQINTVEGLCPNTQNSADTSTWLDRTDQTHFGHSSASSNRGVNLREPNEDEDGFNDPNAFDKTAEVGPLAVDPGETVDLTYTFTVGENDGVDLTRSSIVDHFDKNVFEITEA